MIDLLFVDDEPCVLDAVRRAFHAERGRYRLRFAGSARQALERAAAQAPDAVISDFRMPGMDGASLLRQVRELCPTAIRIVLTGQAEEDDVLRAAAVSHRTLGKPSNLATLRAAIDAALGARAALSALGDPAGSIGAAGLPLRAETRLRLVRLLAAGETGDLLLPVLLESDPGLAAKALQVAGSPAFGAERAAGSLKEAACRLGVRRLLRLADELDPATGEAAPRVRSIARYARSTAELLRRMLAGTPLEEAGRIAGLLHVAGWLIRPAAGAGADPEAGGRASDLVGGALLRLWGVCEIAAEAVTHSSDPESAPPEARALARALHTVRRLALSTTPAATGGVEPATRPSPAHSTARGPRAAPVAAAWSGAGAP